MADVLDNRLRFRISKQNAMFLEHRARTTGKTKSRLVDEALSASFSFEHDDQRDAEILARLDTMMRHDFRHSHDLNLFMESFSLFMQFFFTLSPEIPAIDTEARASRGASLLNQFFDQLSAKVKKGSNAFKQGLPEVFVSEEQFFKKDELKLLKKLRSKRLTSGGRDE